LTLHLCLFIVNNQLDAKFFISYVFIPILYMFRVPLCSSSGESVVLIRYLVYVTLCRWPSSVQVWMELQFHSNLHTLFIAKGHTFYFWLVPRPQK